MMKQGLQNLIGQGMRVAAVLAGLAVSQLAFAEPPPVLPADDNKPRVVVSDGSRVDLPESGFSIVPPTGWEVHLNHPNLTLLMQVPHEKGLLYQRTIQVARFKGPKYIDDHTAREFENVITKKFSEASASLEDYRIRQNLPVELLDGRNSLLFYSEFLLDGVPLMQAHILMSTNSYHYLVTYTDLAEHFESEKADQFLSVAWDSMLSAELDGRTPARFETVYAVAGVAGVLLVLIVVFSIVRQVRANRKYKTLAGSKNPNSLLDDDDDLYDPRDGTDPMVTQQGTLVGDGTEAEKSLMDDDATSAHSGMGSGHEVSQIMASAKANPPPPPVIKEAESVQAETAQDAGDDGSDLAVSQYNYDDNELDDFASDLEEVDDTSGFDDDDSELEEKAG